MNNRHFLKDLSSYLDNQLSESKKIKLEGHLEECSICSQELNKLKTLSEKLKQWQLPSLDPSFDSMVRNKIVAWELEGGRVKMKRKTLSILIPSGAIAGVLIVSLLSINMYMQRGVGVMLESAPNISMDQNTQALTARLDRSNVREGTRLSNSQLSGISEGKEIYHYQTARASGDATDSYLSNKVNLAGAVSRAVISGIPQEEYQPNEGGSVIIIQPVLPATGIGDMIVRSAELKLEVENGKETYQKISEICQELDGYLAESRFFRDEEGRESGRVTLRIPKDKFLAALDKLDGLGKVKDSNTASQDVSQEYANLKSQLEAAKVVYDKMLEALKKRQATIPEAIKLESELTPVLRRIEYFKNQVERLNNLTSFTTITVHFYESEVSAKVLEETKHLIKKEMLAAKIKAVRWLAQNLLFVGFGILLAVAVIAAILSLASWVARFIKRG